MNIADLLGCAKPVADNTVSSKIAFKSEIKKIEREADRIADDILGFISRETEYISKGLTYGGCEPKTISEDDKKELLKKLEEVVKAIPSKIKENVDDIFGSATEEKKEDKKEESESKEDEGEKKEVEVTVAPANPPVIAPSMFGY